jgi:phospholipid/cholesterol/gamma-HCH transport system substrate-binding protein
METRANYLMVGSFVLALAVGLVIFVLWLAKFQFDTEFARYDIVYKGSVTGLRIGSPVRYSGVQVGEVIDISLNGEQPDQVLITIEIDGKTPVRSDSIATLEIEGLTGGLYVLLSGGAPEAPPLVAAPGQKRPVIAARASSLQQVLAGAPELVQSVNVLLARANDLLNADSRAHIASSLANLDQFTSSLAAHSGDIGLVLQDASATMANLRESTATLSDLAAALKSDSSQLVERADATLATFGDMAGTVDAEVSATAGDARALIKDLRGTASRLSGVGKEMQAMVAENREPVRDFTATGLAELTGLVVELRDLVVTLNRVTTEVQRDPARFFFGNQQQGYETRQPSSR